jgi:RimJ/RimL family protein N-acetyltransferase
MTQPTLDTERLRLVPLADEHLEFEVELDSDPEVMRYLAGRARSLARPFTPQDDAWDVASAVLDPVRGLKEHLRERPSGRTKVPGLTVRAS